MRNRDRAFRLLVCQAAMTSTDRDAPVFVVFPKKLETAGLGRLQNHGQHVQKRTLAAAAITHQGHFFAPVDGQIGHLQEKSRRTGPVLADSAKPEYRGFDLFDQPLAVAHVAGHIVIRCLCV